MKEIKWINDHRELAAMARWMANDVRYGVSVICEMLEKPWDWDDEYQQMIKERNDASTA